MAENPGMQPSDRGENPVMSTVRQPRVVLLLLGIWAVIGAVTEFFTSSGLFVDLRGGELDGALGGRVLGWEAIPLAVLYFYCARNPDRYQRVFWLALIEQAAAIVANVYHWGAGDFSAESIVIPVGVAGGWALLVSPPLFEPREPEAQAIA